MENQTKKMWILLGMVFILVIIIVVIAIQSKKTIILDKQNNQVQNLATTKVPATENQVSNTPTQTQSITPAQVVDLRDAKAEVPGASLVTADKRVVTAEGKVANISAMPNSPEAPRATIVTNKAELPKEAINLVIANSVFTPNTVTVKSGSLVTLSVTSGDSDVHVILFPDSNVGALTMTMGPGQTKAITFNAPAKGEYAFRCDAPKHSGRGENGKLIVN